MSAVTNPDTVENARRARMQRRLGYKSPTQRNCCETCSACRLVTGPDDQVTDTTPVHCDVGNFPVERGGLCWSWRKAS